MEKLESRSETPIEPYAARELAGQDLLSKSSEIGQSGDEVEKAVSPEEKAKKFVEGEGSLHIDKELGRFRGFISDIPALPLIVGGVLAPFTGLKLIVGGVGLALSTMGAGIPIGAVLMGLGAGIICLSVASVALGVAKIAREVSFRMKYDKVKKGLKEAYAADSDKLKLGNIKKDLKKVKDEYEVKTLKDSKMKLLELQIKYDPKLKESEKIKLLTPYAEKTITAKDIKDLRAAYESELLLKKERKEKSEDDDLKT